MSEYEGEPDALDRLFKQARGEAKPEYPKGKLNPDDEGTLSFAMAVDKKKKLMILNFNKPVTWLGLYLPDARRLHEKLGEKVKELEELEKQTKPPSSSK